ncbi:MAG TPA: hypothetical protein VGD58_30170 [Herpetosiphonaceae bacterium]
MTIWDDMVSAVEHYPEESIVLRIVEFNPRGNELNVLDEATFRVEIDNRGPLSLTGVTLRIKGLNEVTVANSEDAEEFDPEFITDPLPTIRGHNMAPTLTDTFKLKVPNETGPRMLVQATLETWNPTLLHILNDHSDPFEDGPPRATWSADILDK